MSQFIPDSRDEALKMMRTLWRALIGGQLMFGAVTAYVISTGGMASKESNIAPVMFYVSLGLLVVGVFVAHVMRMQSYKKHWDKNLVTPKGYFIGNLIFWCICEGISLFGIMVVLIAGSFVPYAASSAIALCLMISTWPNGRPMEPAEPELLNRKL